MNSRDHMIMALRRQEMDYQKQAREALLLVDEALRSKDVQSAKQLLSEFVFCEKAKSGRINSTQEAQLIVTLLSDFFAKDDPHKIPLFFNIFEPGKSSRKLLLLKFILTAIAVKSSAALNAAGAYLFDPSTKDFRVSTDFGRLLINEITFFANNSTEKFKSLSAVSPLFVNSLTVIFAETFKDDQMPTPIIRQIITEFVQSSTSPPFIFTFTVPVHIEIGAFLLASFYRWVVLSEFYGEGSAYSRLHLKILECMSNLEPTVPTKPIMYTKYLCEIIDQVERAAKVKDPEMTQRSLERFAQLVQVSKEYLYGNIPLFIERLSKLPKNSLLELVIMSIK